ncbi:MULTISPECIES: ATP-dependent helicase HrpB [unclassified Microbacterium]|uniref:ATP-dependent helicase HrpB n=1 Tax=unclassified Microbacterium TaxID=2609290 RepID=UPI000F88F74C|nr:ATP-dependent helicase HrpB [Microbacterium sp. HSID17254]RUQ06614.1 ATP-dependent helicase HrpB [Microbacterium sp. HSID17254]
MTGQTGRVTRAAFDLTAIGAGLSFAGALDDLSTALDTSGSVVVTAPPGTGKTTLVPPLLASRRTGRVIVTQPRRIAARAAARRLAQLDGTPLGSRVGFTVRGERTVGPDTRVEFVTAGVLLRRMLDDPGLDGVSAVIIDEVHERALETDLLLGLLSEVRELRDDLVVIAMSATLDADRIAAVIGTEESPAPIVDHDVPAFPLTERWAPGSAPRLDERGVTRGFLDHVASVTATAAAELVRNDPEADVLVFAPGAREVAEIARRVRDRNSAFDVRELHGQIPPAEQDAVIRGRASEARPRIIVATSLAESSLTVPGVRLVVDSCLARQPQRDAARGMTGLVTTAASRSSCVQRAGRATRQGPGSVIRCVDERTYAAAPARPSPEIATADLTDATLLLACWGAPGGAGLRMIEPLRADSLADAVTVLRGLGAIDDGGRATAEGRALARIPTDPRLARALRDGSPAVGSRLAAEVVALLGGDQRISDADVARALVALRGGSTAEARRWREDARRLERLVAPAPDTRAGLDGVGLVIALAFPERVAHRAEHSGSGATFLLASGTRAGVSGALAASEWLAVADVARASSRTAAGSGAVIRAAAALTEEQMERASGPLMTDRVEAEFVGGRVQARREHRIGAIVRSSVPVRPSASEGRDAVGRALRRDGLGMFTWSDGAEALRRRLALLRRELGDPWPDVSDAGLLASLDVWLAPELDALASGTPASRLDLSSALRRLLPWPEAVHLDALVPERLEVPSGSRVRITYPEPDGDATARPVVAVKLQECFGWAETPRLVDGRVPVLFHLLSPAGRPLAVTDDLASFWSGPYAQVRAEMRGRYPRHPWPEDPWAAVPTKHTKNRAAR